MNPFGSSSENLIRITEAIAVRSRFFQKRTSYPSLNRLTSFGAIQSATNVRCSVIDDLRSGILFHQNHPTTTEDCVYKNVVYKTSKAKRALGTPLALSFVSTKVLPYLFFLWRFLRKRFLRLWVAIL